MKHPYDTSPLRQMVEYTSNALFSKTGAKIALAAYLAALIPLSCSHENPDYLQQPITQQQIQEARTYRHLD